MAELDDIKPAASDRLFRWIVAALSALAGRSRSTRRWMAVVMDALLCVVATCIALSLRLGEWQLFSREIGVVAGAAILLWFPIAWNMGIYLSLIRFAGGRTMAGLGVAVAVFAIPMTFIFMIYALPPVPRTMGMLQPIIFLGLLCISRLAIRFALVDILHVSNGTKDRRRIAIYGAGRAGQQLALALRHEPQVKIACFLDDDRRLHGQRLDGIAIESPERLQRVFARRQIDEVLIALPAATRARRRQIVEQLQGFEVQVRALPSVGKIIDGDISVSDLREVDIEDLLGRDPVLPNELLLSRTIAGKTVLVSGAGGSIGSELCRQILRCRPRRLILLDQAEYSLYAIDDELHALARELGLDTVEIVAELANVADQPTSERVFSRWRPETVFHAAAYKHVPLVEANPIAGMRNNIFGTLNSCLAAEKNGVATFILISTDKAVRPTNIMGATKRICELILQARAKGPSSTIFTMVRFGNVLGSSGSVVPRFRAQIRSGGPVTLTHRDITRFFMTIPEAAQLVIQAGAMAKGGEVFVLDMGEPVRIADLARAMVRLSGLTVRDADNPDGDIEILETGLRQGEKLYEELLIGDDPRATIHPRILQAQETMLPWTKLSAQFDALAVALNGGDAPAAMAVLRRLVPEYAPPAHHGEVSGSATSDEVHCRDAG